MRLSAWYAAPRNGAVVITFPRGWTASQARNSRPRRRPDVIKVKSTKHPPQNVKFDGEPMPGGITTGTGTATGGAGEVIIPGVPVYSWRDGCGPTAVGIVVGYYDGHGWDELIPGDATSVTADVNQAIATHGSAGAPGHYEDFALPMESGSGVLPDSRELPAGDEHSLRLHRRLHAHLVELRAAAVRLELLQHGGPAFTGYVRLKYAGSTPTSSTYGGRESHVDAREAGDRRRPAMVFLVDSTGDGLTDHFVTIVGYRETNGYPEYACWDTWSTSIIRWQQFRAMSSGVRLGRVGRLHLQRDRLRHPSPTPTPTPTGHAHAYPHADRDRYDVTDDRRSRRSMTPGTTPL